jgi:hypothetical protein
MALPRVFVGALRPLARRSVFAGTESVPASCYVARWSSTDAQGESPSSEPIPKIPANILREVRAWKPNKVESLLIRAREIDPETRESVEKLLASVPRRRLPPEVATILQMDTYPAPLDLSRFAGREYRHTLAVKERVEEFGADEYDTGSPEVQGVCNVQGLCVCLLQRCVAVLPKHLQSLR